MVPLTIWISSLRSLNNAGHHLFIQEVLTLESTLECQHVHVTLTMNSQGFSCRCKGGKNLTSEYQFQALYNAPGTIIFNQLMVTEMNMIVVSVVYQKSEDLKQIFCQLFSSRWSMSFHV